MVGILGLISPVFDDGDMAKRQLGKSKGNGKRTKLQGTVHGGRVGGASASALLFAVHSIHVEAVAGLVGRADILCGIFFMASIIAYHRKHFLLSILFGIVATLCKEVGITVLGYLVFCEALDCFAKSSAPREGTKQRERLLQFAGRRIAILILSILLMVIGRVKQNGGKLYKWTVMENHISLDPSWLRRVMTYAHTHGRYGLFLLFPAPLAFNHGYGCIEMRDTPSLVAVSMYSLLIGAIAQAVLRHDWAVLRCIAMAALPFIPASNVLFPVGTILAERLLYVPSIGFCLLCGLVVQRVVDSDLSPGNLPHTVVVGKKAKSTLVVFVVVFLSLATHTWRSTYAWESELSLYQWGLAAEPNSLTALNNLAYQYMHTSNVSKLR